MTREKYFGINRKRNSNASKLTIVLFTIYLLVLFWILLLKFGVHFSYMTNRSVNLIPFGEYLTSNGKADLGEIILNAVIFLPFGIYTGVLFKSWTLRYKILFFFLVSLLFEGLQFILRIGAFDVTDLITNTVGGIIGLMVFEVIFKLFNNSVKTQNFINIVAATVTVLIISLLVLLKLSMLPIKYQ